MTDSRVYFLGLTIVLILALLAIGGYYLSRLRRSSKSEWKDLLAQLIEVDRKAIDTVALDAIKPTGERRTDNLARELDPNTIWQLLGGLEGIGNLESNSRVLVEMAAYLQRTYPNAANLAEELRLQAKELEFHAGRLKLAAEQGSLEFHIGTYAQNIAVAYYLMERRIQLTGKQRNLAVFWAF